ncbi:MAG: C-terminal binding protein [Anaerolineae bacterium]|nr:C-terminal binding protein [Anaerolineae bacterium]
MSSPFTVVVTDHQYPDLETEHRILAQIGARLIVAPSPAPDDVLSVAADADALLVGPASLTSEIIAGLQRCRVIVRYGVGYDNVDIAAATRRGIPVCNVPDYCIDEVSSHAILLTLACLRRLPWEIEAARKEGWPGSVTRDIPRLAGMTFGILGLGRIGSATARKAAGLGFHVIACDPYIPRDRFAEVGVEPVSFDELIRQSDVLSLHTPLTEETRGLIDESVFKRMKPTAVLVNTARGPIVPNAAVLRALDEGWIAAAGLDVLEQEPAPPDEPLLAHPRAIVTPHIAWYSEASMKELQRKAAEEVARVLSGHPPRNIVNPDVQLPAA